MKNSHIKNLSQVWKIRIILAALALTFLISEKDVESLGDSYQIALPVIALGCSVTNGQAADFAIRYVVHWSIVHGSKEGLGKAKINRRPDGKKRGMPSGHAATAAFGASNLVHQCIEKNPLVSGIVILTAGYVGGSRIEAEKHNIWQVMMGVLVGWGTDRAFRKTSPLGWIRRRIGKPG